MGESRNDYPRHCRCCWRVIRTVDEDYANYEYGGVCAQCAKRSDASEIKLVFPEDFNEVDSDQRDGGYVAELERENAQLREIVRAVANAGADQNYGYDFSLLILCPGDDAETIRDKARALLATGKA